VKRLAERGAAALAGDAALGDGADHLGVEAVLLGEDAGGEALLVVAVLDRHGRLGDDRAGVDALVDEVHGAAGELDAVLEGSAPPRRPARHASRIATTFEPRPEARSPSFTR